MPGKKMMGYMKGGKLDMVEKDGKKVPFYAADGKGKMAEGGKVGKKPKKKMSKEAKKKAPVSRVPGKTKTARGKSLEELGMTPSPAPKVPGKLQSSPMNNTSAPKPPTAAQAATPTPPMGGMMPPPAPGKPPAPRPPMGGAPGGMGAMMKPGMPGMKKGGKVKKAKSKSYGHGGKVRGAGIAKKGVKKCKMR